MAESTRNGRFADVLHTEPHYAAYYRLKRRIHIPSPAFEAVCSGRDRPHTDPKCYRRRLKLELYRYGVRQASMFPGLDGLAEQIAWMNQDCY